MQEYIGESIRVGAVFSHGNIIPKWFMWKHRKITVKTLTYVWQEAVGATTFIHFCASDGANLYELCLNQSKLKWILEKIEIE